jgi:hypothetical protein
VSRATAIRSQYASCIIKVPKITAAEMDSVNVPCGAKQLVKGMEIYGTSSVWKPAHSPGGAVRGNVNDTLTDATPAATKICEPMSQFLRLVKRLREHTYGIGTVLGQPFHEWKNR